MSAYKTAVIRLGESEYLRLRDAEEQLRLLEFNHMDREKKNEFDPTIFDSISRQNDERNREFQNALVGLDKDVRAMEKNTTKWVQSQLKQVEVLLNQSQNNLGAQTNQIYAAIIDQFNLALETHNQNLSQQIFRQVSRLESIESRIDLYTKEARKWIETASKLQALILSHYMLDAQIANSVAVDNQLLNIAIEQYNQGLVESACSTALEIYSDFSQLHAQLEAANVLRLIHYKRLLDLATDVRNHVESQLQVHAMDVDGNELSDMVDVDFWTEGGYANIVNDLNLLLNEISKNPDMLEFEIDEKSNKLVEIEKLSVESVTQARFGVLSSQLRFNIAQIVVQALETQGFNLEEANFNRKDYRDAFTAKTRNLSGNEVLVTIDPSPSLEEGGKLHIASNDGADLTEHELVQRNQEIFKAILDAGLNLSDIHANNNNAIDSKIQKPGKPQIDRQKIQVHAEKNNHGRR